MSDSSRWVELALEDEKMAELAYGEKLYNQVCFHSQQGAEKFLKAFLVEKKGKFPKVHSLVELLGLVGYLDQNLKALRPACTWISFTYQPVILTHRWATSPKERLTRAMPKEPWTDSKKSKQQ